MNARFAQMNRLVCAALRGEAPAWPYPREPDAARAFVGFCGYHGIGPLLHDRLADTPAWAGWHTAVRDALTRETLALSAVELLRERELQRVGQAFAAQGVDGLLLKGAALAYGLYRAPVLRTRTDTDILVAPGGERLAGEVLTGLGYRRPLAIDGELIKSQAQYLSEATSPGLTIDLHWRLTNTHVFADTLSFAELAADAYARDGFGPALRIPDAVALLLHACIHRAVNLPQRHGNRLIWLFDVHLLAASLDDARWRRFVALAGEKRITAVCADSLRAAQAHFATPLPGAAMRRLRAPAARRELSARLLDADPLGARLLNYRALNSWGARAQMLKEQLFPSAAFMRRRFGVRGRLGLLRAYGQRILGGLR